MTVKLEITQPDGEMKALLDKVEQGNEVVISSAGREIARVVPLTTDRPDRSKLFGAFKGQIWMADEFDVLPEEELERWYK